MEDIGVILLGPGPAKGGEDVSDKRVKVSVYLDESQIDALRDVLRRIEEELHIRLSFSAIVRRAVDIFLDVLSANQDVI